MLPETADVALRIREAKIDEIKNLLKDKKDFTSAVGHASTASLLSQLLKIQVPMNRISIKLKESDLLIVFQLMMRLDEGRILTEDEVLHIPFKFYTVEILPSETIEAIYHW